MLRTLEMAFPGFKLQKFPGGGFPRTPLQDVGLRSRRRQDATVILDVCIRLCVVRFLAYSVTTVNFTCTSEHDFENQKQLSMCL